MKYRIRPHHCVLIILFVLYDCHGFIKRPKHRILVQYISWKFYLQPYRGTKIYFNRQLIQPKKISTDKTRALLKLKTPVYKDQLGFFLEIKKNKFHTFQKDIFLLGEHKEWLQKNQTFVLSHRGSRHKFHSYHTVGRQPKSITFMNEYAIAIPLLNDSGIDILNIKTGEKKRIKPPKKYARYGGFVESLVIKDQNELWVSQMSKNSLHIFDMKNFQYKKSIRLSGTWVKLIAYHAKRKLVYASNWLSQNISVVNPHLYQEIKTIPVSGVPRGIWLKPDSNEMFVAQFGGKTDIDQKGRVLKIDVHSAKNILKMGKDGAKRHIVYSDFTEKLYVSDMKRSVIEIYDPEDDIYVTSISTNRNPNTIALDPSHRYLYVSCRGPNSPLGYLQKSNVFGTIDVIDLKNHRIVESIEGGNQPTGLDISPDGKYMVFSDFLDHAIRIYERLDN